MSMHVPDGLSAEERRRLLDALFAYVDAPSDAAELTLRRAAPASDDDQLVRLGQALHAAPKRLRSAWRGDLNAADGAPLLSRVTPPSSDHDLLADRRITHAMVAYLDARDEVTRAALLRMVPGPEGEDLVAYADALPVARRSRWCDLLRRAKDEVRSVFRPAPSRGRAQAAGRVLPGLPLPDRLARRGVGRRLSVTALVALVVAVTAGITSYLVLAQPRRPPARPTVTLPSLLTDWRFAGTIDQRAWLATPGAADAVAGAALTCPSDTTCYATDATSGPGGAIVESTTDGGASWHPEPLPVGVHLTSALTCPAVEQCVGAGYVATPSGTRHPSVVVTTDGGASWTTSSLPDDVGTVANLACVDTQDCVGIGSSTQGAGDPGSGGPPIAVSTVDGGTSWKPGILPGSFVPSPRGLACTNPQDCVIVGTTTLTGVTQPSEAVGAALYTTDGGAQWSSAPLPPHTGAMLAAACSTGGHCLATADSSLSTTSGVDRPNITLTTTASGRSWNVAANTGLAIGGAKAISCPTAERCWVGGWQLASPNTLRVEMALTQDAGATWATVPLPRHLTAAAQHILGRSRLHVFGISSISCPSVGDCVALASQFTANPTAQQVVLRYVGAGG